MPTKKMKKAVHKNCYQFDCSRSRVGTVVRTLISHQCVLVPIPDSVPQVCGGQEDSTFPLSTPFNPPPLSFLIIPSFFLTFFFNCKHYAMLCIFSFVFHFLPPLKSNFPLLPPPPPPQNILVGGSPPSPPPPPRFFSALIQASIQGDIRHDIRHTQL